MVQKPRGGAGSGTALADSRPVSIGTVLNLLRDEFPEVTISKIRFLEAEGLIDPQRTPSGYRKFSVEDVERLAHVLRMQRDHYLPLKVIREHLDAVERGEQVPLPVLDRQGTVRPQEAPQEPTVTRLGRAELLAAAQVGERELAEWESYGLIAPLPGGDYDAQAVKVAGLVAELGRCGIEPRHLRVTKAAAEREAGLVEQIVAPLRRHRNPQTRAHAEDRTKEIAELAVGLHSALVETALKVRLS
ncbi:transcriptional regulator FtsR [Streptomyces tsukubensis]|uniref:MerR family transcriptional regulator n=1 Tax=Streptomyces tsukubensis TaxID=83656 RepID=A0A1V4A6S4_9ACTN|nr:MerR family transcriptional regulator [Streptomyces tsukubensis]OON77384.1 MerR family transcriptional regulator [Streptomyces tsukubensis]QFR92468.1 MerR family DNA-binding transcriptional regulator [Streptomyces tsukubensis]